MTPTLNLSSPSSGSGDTQSSLPTWHFKGPLYIITMNSGARERNLYTCGEYASLLLQEISTRVSISQGSDDTQCLSLVKGSAPTGIGVWPPTAGDHKTQASVTKDLTFCSIGSQVSPCNISLSHNHNPYILF